MAYYKDFNDKKNHKKTDYAATGSWDDEGTHYSGRKPAFKDSYKSSFHKNSERKPYGESKAFGDKKFSTERKPYGKPAVKREERSFTPAQKRFGPQAEAAPSYKDFEYVPKAAPAPVQEENPVQENLLTGRNPIREALKSGRDLEKLLVARGELSGSAREIVMMAKERHIPVQEVERTRLDEITRNHQGLVAFASAFQYATVEDILAVAQERGEDPFIILLDGITDPHNLGAIIRSAECAGAHGVIVPQRRSVGLTPAAVKASAGAVEYTKVARVVNLSRTLEDLKKKGLWFYAAAMDGEDYRKVDFSGPVGLVIGAEGEGISRLVAEQCDKIVSLPMKGHIDSLNASVAAGILMYAVMGKRG